ncbi:hypothetical protein [uncultured Tateyamaria sp.]|uniref:hypothetical protein n=1 Tax=uncultured Tateyamaria sp. TaxID=455651 RepID=UPI0026069DBB|nr:hypothetical protein [uncultured Tateyamaria sp.]
METYFRAFRYDTSEQRVIYEAEYNTDITVEPMYRFLINMSHGSELPFGFGFIKGVSLSMKLQEPFPVEYHPLLIHGLRPSTTLEEFPFVFGDFDIQRLFYKLRAH